MNFISQMKLLMDKLQIPDIINHIQEFLDPKDQSSFKSVDRYHFKYRKINWIIVKAEIYCSFYIPYYNFRLLDLMSGCAVLQYSN